MLVVKRVHAAARLPVRATAGAAGYDLAAAESRTIPPKGSASVSTGLCLIVPEGCYGRVAPRSGLAVRFGIDTGAGVIDRDYRGIVHVVLFNHGDGPYVVSVGDRIAQLILERIVTPVVHEVPEFTTDDATARDTAGFGSTGVTP